MEQGSHNWINIVDPIGSTQFIYLGLSWGGGDLVLRFFHYKLRQFFLMRYFFFNEVGIKKSEVIKLILVPNSH